MNSIWNGIRNDFRGGDTVMKLLFVNIGVFLAVNVLMYLFFWAIFGSGFAEPWEKARLWLALPHEPFSLLTRPWTFITYMYTHQDFGHIFWNMFALYWFGAIFRDVVGGRFTFAVYTMGGLMGALFFLGYAWSATAMNQTRSLGPLLGASAAVEALIVAAAATAPYYRVFVFLIGPVRIVYIALFTIVLFLIDLPNNNTGGQFTHLGGVAFGFLYAYGNRKGWNLGERFNKLIDGLVGLMPWSKPVKRRPQMQAHRNPARATATAAAGNTFGRAVRGVHLPDSRINQERIDAILEKIKQSGYSSLSEEEKEYLFRASKEQP